MIFLSDGIKITLYADDTKIWREIITSQDHFALQNDILKTLWYSTFLSLKHNQSLRNKISYKTCPLPNYKLNTEYIDYVKSQND